MQVSHYSSADHRDVRDVRDVMEAPGAPDAPVVSAASSVPATPVTPSLNAVLAAPGMREERLPFRVRIAHDEASLVKAVRLRQAAYGRHVADLARSLGKPEPCDLSNSTVVLLAESKLDGQPLGTMRIQCNDEGPLGLEQSVNLPAWLQGRHLAEATRLGVVGGSLGNLAKTVLFKTYYLYCLAVGVDYMVIVGRSPLDRQYSRLLFEDVFPGQGFIPMRHVGNIAHRVLALDVAAAKGRWAAAQHPLYDFMVHIRHPDIVIDGARHAHVSLFAPAIRGRTPHMM